ncbi:helix-turn-helix transcriptional regulator [Paenibacillus sp. IB182496]|uniref:Helix-turn-helix transcriptional regulator n=1 Tax=Paenibacillus sabuli TaxID=2772509 RepID=A0A927BRB8_9BACL|nr:helix-turn-helix domain-containing protein [Paenibacillus sabuli]MBD2844270.1 helix-turn-helix transcriptional regulator [Paenibacillus sabuli]
MREKYNLPCNIAQSLNVIGDRWTLLIIHEIMIGHATFNEIKKGLAGLSSKLLSERLKYLEREGLVEAELYSAHPPRYRYALTDGGRDLEDVFHALVVWGKRNLRKCYKKLTHTSCGHEVRISYHCEHCAREVERKNVNVVTLAPEEQPSR